MTKKYDPAVLHEGVNRLAGGEEIYYISNPAVGLWAIKRKAQMINWGIIGCGNVTELKSGPAFSKVAGSRLAAVMRRES